MTDNPPSRSVPPPWFLAGGPRHWIHGVLALAHRELLSLFVTPLAYGVATLFLLQQGYDFALLLRVLNDPLAAPGPVMQYYFGGSFFIFWLPVVAICSAVSMGLLAEERKQGTLEAVLTAPVRPSQLVVGKYLGALGFYCALWLPTGLFYVLLRGAAIVPDPGPIAAGYLGTFMCGASFLGVGLVASAASRSQLGAAVATFVACTLMLLSGLLVPEVQSPTFARLLSATSLLTMMQELAQGIVDGRWLWLHAAWVVVTLWAACVLIDPRRDRQRVLRWVLGAVTAGHLATWGMAHATRGDWTGGEVYGLSPRAIEVLQQLDGPIDVRLMVPATLGGGRANPLHGELREVLTRMGAATSALRISELDPDRDHQQAQQLIGQFGLAGRELADGVVLVQAGTGTELRRAHLLPQDLVRYATGPSVAQTGPRIQEFRGEEALLGAFVRVSDPVETRICVTQGHGEPALDSLEPYAGYAHLEGLLKGANLKVEVADLQGVDGLAGCAVVLVAGPTGFLPAAHAAAIERFAEGGGDLLVFAGAVLRAGERGLAPLGLEPLLATYGLNLGGRVVVDPHPMPGGTPYLAFTLVEGWGDHPAAARLVGQAVSLMLVRELTLGPSEGVAPTALLSVGETAWAEGDLTRLAQGELPEYDDVHDLRGPMPVAAAGERGGSRVVVIASDQFALNAFFRDDVVYDHGRDLVLNAVGWLTERHNLLGLRPRPREQVKLVLLPEQLQRMTLVCLLGLPGFSLLLGLWVWWRRRP